MKSDVSADATEHLGRESNANSDGALAVQDSGAVENPSQLIPDILSFDEFEKRQRLADLRRARLTGVGLAVAAVVAPVATLMLTGRFSLANLRGNPVAVETASAQPHPTPRPLSAADRKILETKISTDLRKYVWEELLPVGREEQIAEKAFASVTDANYKDDKTSCATIRNVVVPHFKQSIAIAQTIAPQTEQLRAVHHLMLTSSRLKLMAYEQIAAGEGDKDVLWRPGVLAEFAESARRARIYHEAIAGLARETNAKLP